MPKVPLAILFDADGTLYDSERLHHEANRLTAKELYDFDFTWELYETNLIKGTKSAMHVMEDHGITIDHGHFLSRRKHHQSVIVTDNLQLMPGAKNFLKWCRLKGIICVVVSAARLETIEILMAATDIQSYFEEVVSFDDVGKRRKPDTFPYELGLQRIGVEAAQAIAVEDTAKGIASAKGAGLTCFGIRNNENNDKALSQADHVISGYDELKAYLLR